MCLELVVPQFRLNLEHGIHGISHWARVWRNGRELAEAEGVDSTVPCLFAFLHDSQRFDDGSDPEHGHRAVQWIHKLYARRRLPIPAGKFYTLCEAIEGHSFGGTHHDPVVQVCFDSDRLDLGRVGIRPDPERLCTAHAKNATTIQHALNRSLRQPRNSTFILNG